MTSLKTKVTSMETMLKELGNFAETDDVKTYAPHDSASLLELVSGSGCRPSSNLFSSRLAKVRTT